MSASGFHLGLICAMASRGAACPLCITTARVPPFAATALGAGSRPPVVAGASRRLAWPRPLELLAAPPAPPVEFAPHTRIVAYTRADCPYCDDLRDRVLPEATRGLDVEIVYRDAATADFVRRAPTLLLSSRTAGTGSWRVSDGRPTPRRDRVIGGYRP